MTNILQLPTFSSQTQFAITINSDWLDSIFFSSPNSPTQPIEMVGAIAAGSDVVNVDSVLTLVPGLRISAIQGIPLNTMIGAIDLPSSFHMADASTGLSVKATFTNIVAQLTFEPIPLDLTGIDFKLEVKREAGGHESFLTLTQNDGTLLNSGAAGILTFHVPYDDLEHIHVGNYVFDIIATADGHTVNLFPDGPGQISITAGVTTHDD